MVSAKMVIGTIEGVDRPALATVLPNLTGHCLLLDVGANPDAKTEHFKEFAVMGSIYAQLAFGKQSPSVGLMSIGEEDTKGSERSKEAFKTLKETGLNFIGNVEGRDVFNGKVDVIVTDGFTGNVILKVSESLSEMVEQLLREEIKRTLKASVGFLLSRTAFRRFKTRLDYSEYGGAPLLGVKGCVIICHGRSSAKAIKNAIRFAAEFSRRGLAQKSVLARGPPLPRGQAALVNRARIIGTGAAVPENLATRTWKMVETSDQWISSAPASRRHIVWKGEFSDLCTKAAEGR
jgi:glycerol-3-phosphate acyltransferase PlsX